VDEHTLLPPDVLGVAITQLATRPMSRWVIGSGTHRPQRLAFVVTDLMITPQERYTTAVRISRVVGTLTEAAKRADAVRWLPFCSNHKLQDIAHVVASEVDLARAEYPRLDTTEVVILVWKSRAESFGAPLLDVTRHICDAVFTVGTESVKPFIDPEDEPEAWRGAQ
jgi:hypothetical protein